MQKPSLGIAQIGTDRRQSGVDSLVPSASPPTSAQRRLASAKRRVSCCRSCSITIIWRAEARRLDARRHHQTLHRRDRAASLRDAGQFDSRSRQEIAASATVASPRCPSVAVRGQFSDGPQPWRFGQQLDSSCRNYNTVADPPSIGWRNSIGAEFPNSKLSLTTERMRRIRSGLEARRAVAVWWRNGSAESSLHVPARP